MKIEKWYLQTWFIALLFVFSIFVIPFVVGCVLLIKQYKAQRDMKRYWDEIGITDAETARNVKESCENEVKRLNKEEEKLKQQIAEISRQKEVEKAAFEQEKKLLKAELIELEDEVLLQSFGFYDPKYDLENSEAYKVKLESIRAKQKEMVKNKQATNHSEEWTLDGSKQKGQVLNNNNIKLTLNAFNNECDTAISKVKFSNIASMESRIKKSYNNLNKINKHNRIEIKKEYLALKLDELYLSYEYALKLEEEKEEQRRIKEEMREEARVLKEIEREKAKIEKEEKHFEQEIASLQKRLETENEEERKTLEDKIRELEEKLNLVRKDKEDVYNREQNTRAGYVYIISNIGSFGENVYKIGMTRRLEPMDRIKELGSASVPFLFDVHAMIFSQDAPNLERALHQAFHAKRLNKINDRKEFFRVTLAEIEREVRHNHSETVQFTKMAEAKEYRESLMLSKNEATHEQPVGVR